MGEQWTTQQMRDNAANWSLAGDAGMLNYLVHFSQGVIEKAHNVTASLDTLGAQIDATQSDLSNVCNEFNALAHSQFVESRVAEEEEEAATTSASVETEAPPYDGEAVAQEVLQNSLAFLDEMFDVVEVPVGSDSEDEDDSSPANSRHTQLILKPVNPYANRRLPHIIGSLEFEQDDNVGLVLTPSDDEDSESPLAEIHLARAQISDSSSEADVGATFSLPSDGEDEIFMPKPPPIPQSLSAVSFADELARKLGGASEVTKQGGSGNKATKPSASERVNKPAVSKAVPQNGPPLDQREPPSMFGGDQDDADDDWIFGASSRGTFSGGRGLFDDTTPETQKSQPVIEDDIFSSPSSDKPVSSTPAPIKVATSTPVTSKTTPSKHGDLFGEDGAQDDLFSKSTSTGKRKSSTLLFSDEEDLFAAPSRLNPPPKSPDLFNDPDLQPARVAEARITQAAQQVAKSAEVSREESPRPQDTPSTKKLPAGAVSMFGGKSVFPSSALRRQTSSSSEESVEPTTVARSQQNDDRVATPHHTDNSNVATSQQAKSANIAAISQQISSVISQQAKSVSNVARSQQSEAKTASSVVKSTPKAVEPQIAKTKTASKKQASIFDENDSEEDLFSSPRATNKPAAKEKVSLFGDSDTEDVPAKTSSKTNLFATQKTAKTTEVESKSKKTKSKIFNNSDSEDDVIFSSASSGSSKSSKLFESSKTARHGLFDDDWLFNSSKGETPGLFGTSQAPDLFAEVQDAKIERKKEVVTQNSSESDDLFGSDKNVKITKSDDLFAEPKTSKPKAEIKEDDLFGSEKNTKIPEPNDLLVGPKIPKPQAEIKKEDLFEEPIISKPQTETKDLFGSDQTKKVTGSNDLFAEPKILKSQVEIKDNKDDLFGKANKPKESINVQITKSEKEIKSVNPKQSKEKPVSLFDSDEDDIFAPKTKKNLPSNDDLFVADDLFAKPSETNDKLFEDNLFSSGTKNIPKSSNIRSSGSNIGPNIEPNTSNIEHSSFKAVPLGPETNKNIFATSMEPEEDLFSSQSKNVAPKTTTKDENPLSTEQNKIDAKLDLFSAQKNETKSTEASIDENLFSSLRKEVDLFPSEETPKVDLFSVQKPALTEEALPEKQEVSKLLPAEKAVPEKPRREPPKSLNVSPASSLFSETESKDVLFSDSNLKPPSEAVKKISPVQRGFALNINPLALLPGQGVKPYKQSISTESAEPEAQNPEVKEVPEPMPRVTSEKTEVKPRNTETDIEKPEIIPRTTEKPEIKPRNIENILEKPEVKPRNAETKPETKPREKIVENSVPEIVVKSSPVEEAVSFEEAVIGSTLHCPGKDRIKIQHKRKASTRRGRISQNTPSPILQSELPTSETSPGPISVTSPSTTVPNVGLPTTVTPSNDHKTSTSPTAGFVPPPLLDREPPPLPPSNPMSPSTDEEDVFDLPPEYLDDEDALFKPVPSLNFDATSTSLFPDTMHEQDLFSTPSLYAQSPSLVTQSPSATQSPSLTTQSPSLTKQSPSVFTESPSLTTQSSILATQSPSLTTQSASLFAESASLTTQSVSLFAEPSSLFVESPSLTTPSPSLYAESSNLATHSPSLTTQSASLFAESPSLTTQSGDLFAESPSLTTQSANLFAESFAESPSLTTQSANLFAESSSLTTQSASLFAESPSLTTQSGDLFAESPSLTTQSASIFAESPSLFAESPSLAAQSPSLATQSPSLATQSPSLVTQSRASVPAKKTPPAAAKDIFDEDDDDDIFSTPVKPSSGPRTQTPKSQAQKSQTPKSQPPKPKVTKSLKSKGLFSDSDDEDLFSTLAKSPLVKSTGKSQSNVAKSQPSVTKPTSSVAKSTSNALNTSEDDFEDPLMAFQQD